MIVLKSPSKLFSNKSFSNFLPTMINNSHKQFISTSYSLLLYIDENKLSIYFNITSLDIIPSTYKCDTNIKIPINFFF